MPTIPLDLSQDTEWLWDTWLLIKVLFGDRAHALFMTRRPSDACADIVPETFSNEDDVECMSDCSSVSSVDDDPKNKNHELSVKFEAEEWCWEVW